MIEEMTDHLRRSLTKVKIENTGATDSLTREIPKTTRTKGRKHVT